MSAYGVAIERCKLALRDGWEGDSTVWMYGKRVKLSRLQWLRCWRDRLVVAYLLDRGEGDATIALAIGPKHVKEHISWCRLWID